MDILLWHEILEPYELAVKELQVKFRHLIKEHHGNCLLYTSPSPRDS